MEETGPDEEAEAEGGGAAEEGRSSNTAQEEGVSLIQRRLSLLYVDTRTVKWLCCCTGVSQAETGSKARNENGFGDRNVFEFEGPKRADDDERNFSKLQLFW